MLAGAALGSVLPQIATAADLPVKAPPMMPAPIVASWTGLYIGGNVGYSAGSSNINNATTATPPPTTFLSGAGDMAVTGAVGGVQLGYNWQLSPVWLFGIEGDFQWSGQRGQLVFTDVIPVVNTVESKLNWFATVRGRFGYITGNSLWYVTGGWADGERELNTTTNFAAGALAGALSTKATKSGWTVGGGVETKLWNSNWSAKLEFLHLDFGTVSNAFPLVTAAGVVTPFTTATSAKLRDEVIRVGVNYKFW
jgi:outer membrane immunogenic protein